MKIITGIIGAVLGVTIGLYSGQTTAGANDPNLCTLGYDGQPHTFGAGWLCFDCGMVAPCDPQNGSGWLCCGATGICVQVQTADECDTGLCGWCEDIAITKLRNGIEIAICET